MGRLMFGAETEYAVTAFNRAGNALERAGCVTSLAASVAARVKSMPSDAAARCDHFLQNGARVYVDCGLHPEYSGPECTTPEEAVSHLRAGDRLFDDAARQYQKDHADVAEVVVSRCNVDYSGTCSTWGSHESYLHDCADTALMADQLVPHLVSRIVFTGAGGFSNRCAGLEFMLAPRVMHLEHTKSNNSTGNRGIFHNKEEPLCAGYRRLHLICGESLGSQLADYLRFGTTALVVALIANGLNPADGFQPIEPVEAMRRFASDPTGTTTRTRLRNGRYARALDIQRNYLQRVEDNIDAAFLPAWAADCCAKWRAVLDALDNDPESLVTRVDWAIKLALFKQHAQQRGFDWQQLPVWNDVAASLQQAMPRSKRLAYRNLVNPTGTSALSPRLMRRLTASLHHAGLAWEQLDDFRALQESLYEIDTRFSQIGSAGIFNRLDAAGVLDHRVVSARAISNALRIPPAVGRARLRSKLIRETSGKVLQCGWGYIVDRRTGRRLDLSDPWESVRESWST